MIVPLKNPLKVTIEEIINHFTEENIVGIIKMEIHVKCIFH